MTQRKISETDLKAHEEIHALLHKSFAYMEGRIDPPSSLHQLTTDKIATQAKEHEIWVVGSPVIACMFLTQRADHLYLGKLAVDPGHRSQGLATRLIDQAAGRARALALPALELQTRIELKENHQLFSKLGFVKIAEGSHPGYQRATEITMRRVVNYSADS